MVINMYIVLGVAVVIIIVYVLMRNKSGATYENVTPEVVKGLLNDKDYQFIDVREPFEYAAGHIKKAINIPLGIIDNNLGKINKDKKIVFICKSGGRSSMASKKVSKLGYDVYNMTGGMNAWTYDVKKK